MYLLIFSKPLNNTRNIVKNQLRRARRGLLSLSVKRHPTLRMRRTVREIDRRSPDIQALVRRSFVVQHWCAVGGRTPVG